MPSTTVRPGKLHAVVSESGIVTTSSSWSVINAVEGDSIINWILPDRSIVKKGDLVGQLDSLKLKEQLKKQLDIVKAAEHALWNATLEREVAEIAVVEYKEGVAVQDRASLQQTLDDAAAAVAKADARLERTRQARQLIREAIDREKGVPSPASILAELDIQDRLEAAEENSGNKKKALAEARATLRRYETATVPDTIEQLKAQAAKAQASELAAKTRLNAEQAKKEKLERQIKNCNFYAPGDGVIVHANDTRYSNRINIANGATVRERQIICKIPNAKSLLRVITRVPAWSIAHVEPGTKARLTIDGMADRVFTGKVMDVAPLPDPIRYRDTRKVYTTWVRFDDPPASLVLDQGVKVEFDIGDFDNVPACAGSGCSGVRR